MSFTSGITDPTYEVESAGRAAMQDRFLVWRPRPDSNLTDIPGAAIVFTCGFCASSCCFGPCCCANLVQDSDQWRVSGAASAGTGRRHRHPGIAVQRRTASGEQFDHFGQGGRGGRFRFHRPRQRGDCRQLPVLATNEVELLVEQYFALLQHDAGAVAAVDLDGSWPTNLLTGALVLRRSRWPRSAAQDPGWSGRCSLAFSGPTTGPDAVEKWVQEFESEHQGFQAPALCRNSPGGI